MSQTLRSATWRLFGAWQGWADGDRVARWKGLLKRFVQLGLDVLVLFARSFFLLAIHERAGKLDIHDFSFSITWIDGQFKLRTDARNWRPPKMMALN